MYIILQKSIKNTYFSITYLNNFIHKIDLTRKLHHIK